MEGVIKLKCYRLTGFGLRKEKSEENGCVAHETLITCLFPLYCEWTLKVSLITLSNIMM